jgi:MFS family permease
MAVKSDHRWAVLVVLCAAALIINVDNTILNVALPTLVRDLHATSSQLQWIVDSYAMVFAGLLLVSGSLADRFGRKRFFLLGLAVFGAGPPPFQAQYTSLSRLGFLWASAPP